MVPEARKRMGGRALRQRFVDRRSHRAAARRRSDAQVRQLAAGVPAHGRARLSLAAAVPIALLSARELTLGSPRPSATTSSLTASLQAAVDGRGASPGYSALLRLPQTWGIIIGKALTDPVWFFITDWFAIYLVSRGFSLERGLLAFWVPFLAADAGNFLGGGLSSYLISRGFSVGGARKIVIVISGLGMSTLMASLLFSSLFWLTVCFAVATCAYAALSTMVLNLPADIYRPEAVATVSGLSGAGAGLGTIAATYLTGAIADRYSFEPILIGASLVPLLAVIALVTLVRNTGHSRLVQTNLNFCSLRARFATR